MVDLRGVCETAHVLKELYVDHVLCVYVILLYVLHCHLRETPAGSSSLVRYKKAVFSFRVLLVLHHLLYNSQSILHLEIGASLDFVAVASVEPSKEVHMVN